MESIKCPKCGTEMSLELEMSYYADPEAVWICTECGYQE